MSKPTVSATVEIFRAAGHDVSGMMFNTALGAAGTFWLYGVICLIGFIVYWKYIPETRNKSLEQIEKELCDESGENS